MITITIHNNTRAFVEGDFDDSALDDAFSFRKSKFWFRSRAAKMGLWDGKTHLFHRASGAFPLGLLRDVRKWLEQNAEGPIDVVDNRADEPIEPSRARTTLEGIESLRPDQRKAVVRAVRRQRGIIHAGTGCLSGATIVGVHRGGKSFELSIKKLVHRFNGGAIRWGKVKQRAKKRDKGMRWDPATPTFVRYRASDGTIRLTQLVGAYKSGVKMTYVLKTYDGRKIKATKDHRFLTDVGWLRLEELKKGDRVYVSTKKRFAKEDQSGGKKRYRVIGGLKHHPHAGRKGCGKYSRPEHVLVLEAYLNECALSEWIKKNRKGEFTGDEQFIDPKKWHVHHLDGDPNNNDPMNLQALRVQDHLRKHGDYDRLAYRTELVTVESIKEYKKLPTYDLEVADEGHNFIANSFVVHNSGKTEIAIAITKKLKIPVTLFVTGQRKLARQTRERYAKRLGVPLEEIGFIGEGVWEDGATGVYVAVVNTLVGKYHATKRRKLYKEVKLLFLDEAHHAGSTTWYQTIGRCNARYRFGLTGTPVGRSDGGDLYLRACTGPVIVRIRSKTLVESGVLAEPTVFFTEVRRPVLMGQEYSAAYSKGIVANQRRNNLIVKYANDLGVMGKQTLVLVHEIAHGVALESAVWNASFVKGGMRSSYIDNQCKAFERGDFPTLIATSIFNEGVDIPSIDALLIAAGGRSVITTLQRIGRGLRRKKGDNRLFVFDFMDLTNAYLRAHSEERLSICKREGFKTVMLKQPGDIRALTS